MHHIARRSLLSAALLLSVAGCTSTNSTNTARTGMEQLLIANAIDTSLSKIDFRPFSGHKVFLDSQYVDCVDKNYLVGTVRNQLVASGAQLMETREDADVVLELRAGAVGTDTSESFLGVPEIALPGLVTLPEVRFLTRNNQSGVAKIGLVAIDANTGVALGSGGNSLAQSQDNNWYLLGMGPIQSGTVQEEVERSTTGSSAYVRSPLPTRVVFATPPPNFDSVEPETQYTGGEDAVEPPPTTEAGLVEPTSHWYDQ